MEALIGTQTALIPKTAASVRPEAALRLMSGAAGFSLRPAPVPAATRLLDQPVTTRVRLRKGDTLFYAGDRFKGLYTISSGFCKTVMRITDGQERVSGFYMSGDVLGTDGIGNDSHECDVIALADTELCLLPFDRVGALVAGDRQFQNRLHRLLSQEIVRERNLAHMLGSMHAVQRLAAFLLDLSQRYQVRGYSPLEFDLRMKREEIGSYLGLKLETVSRLCSRFQQEGLIQVLGRVVKLIDRAGLKELVEASA